MSFDSWKLWDVLSGPFPDCPVVGDGYLAARQIEEHTERIEEPKPRSTT